jgi:S1-C subfamily serine protease
MFRTTIAAAAAASALLTGPAGAADGWKIYQEVRPSMVQVVGVTPTGRYHMGSGVVLPNGTIVTNCHVTLGAARIQLFGSMSGSDSASLQAATVGHDLCALHFPDVKRMPVTVGESRKLKVGDPVYAIGFNAGKGLTYQTGEVAELFEYDGAMVIRTTSPFTHGASGGGLFDQNGQLVGILTFFRVAPSGTSYFAVPAEWLQALEHAPAREIGPLEGLPFWAQSAETQPAFLRAGALEADQRWLELLSVARDWTQSNPADGQAWLALAKAELNAGDRSVARVAYKRAIELGVIYPAAAFSIETDEH